MYLYFGCRVTENKIKTILGESGIIISDGQISNILTKENMMSIMDILSGKKEMTRLSTLIAQKASANCCMDKSISEFKNTIISGLEQ
jgi:hypothetical protein